MRILFVLSRMAHVRHFDRAVRLLADRGHDVVLASQDDDVELRGPVAGHPRIGAVACPRDRADDWLRHATVVRRARDYLRYLHPRYSEARLLRARAFKQMARGVSKRTRDMPAGLSELPLGLNRAELKRLDALLLKIESAVPEDAEIRGFVARHRPDAIVLSPMVGVGFSQADFVKSARALGIPTGMLAFSWDNLSNKGLIHEVPDRMFVWNEVQRGEAVELHRYPDGHIVITGAPRFDEFFEMRPVMVREEFCRQVGLDPARPIVTYLCSSKFVAAREQRFVERWIAALRQSSDPAVAGCSLIVRPHPAGEKDWHAETRHVVRWPGALADKASVSRPFADARAVVMSSRMQNADRVLHETLFHSAAVVGLNTSAEIEAAIVGRPVYTIVDPDAAGQRGTLHFHYLLRANGGHVELAETFDDHRRQLAAALAGDFDREAIAAFVRGFVRPKGVEVPVAPVVADAIEELAARRASADPASLRTPLVPSS